MHAHGQNSMLPCIHELSMCATGWQQLAEQGPTWVVLNTPAFRSETELFEWAEGELWESQLQGYSKIQVKADKRCRMLWMAMRGCAERKQGATEFQQGVVRYIQAQHADTPHLTRVSGGAHCGCIHLHQHAHQRGQWLLAACTCKRPCCIAHFDGVWHLS